MRICTKCSIALHCLICIAVFDGRRMTSTGLAASTGSNPVVIRNLFGALQKAGILSVARGNRRRSPAPQSGEDHSVGCVCSPGIGRKT